ncbi:MAG: phosphoribosylaminoimidazolesuccinocarboxamide synthase [Myxococcales bacterium]|nr:phosphoribosylaminoimidazolesuccinocarboxamide synthase [Myxococcales bacterium]MCB9708990.1 phosphoribosylaminoimidazolesuccinocarboxamide synthase [Myxococcales bacterium]
MGTKMRGKVRDSYLTNDDRRVIVVTDRISAFDCHVGTLPFKGQVLNQLAAWWFTETAEVVPNHVLSVPDPCATIVRECTPLAAEFIMRAYLTGVTSTSIFTHYSQGKREFCGHMLPEGLTQNQALPHPILTPSTKAEHGEHDVSVSREELLAMGKITPEDFDTAAAYARILFEIGQKKCAEKGLILVDTKYEFGKTQDGFVVVIDEIHTPDSSRFWFSESYQERLKQGQAPESFDKEYVRRWLAEQGFTGEGKSPVLPDEVRIEASRRYMQACSSICGQEFEPDLQDPIARLRKNLNL